MEIELSDFKDGKPMIFKGSGDQIQRINELRKAKNYKQILKLSMEMPPNKDTYKLRANALLHLREWNKLVDCCNNGLALDEEQSQFYNLKGKAMGKLGNQEEKVSLIKQALQINDKVAAYHRNLGAALYNLKQYKNAIVQHGRAIQLEPQNPINYHNKGAAYFRLNQFNEAKVFFTSAIQRDPKLALSYSWLGDTERQLGNKQQAIKLYDKAYKISESPVYLKEKQKLMNAMEQKGEKIPKKKKFLGIF